MRTTVQAISDDDIEDLPLERSDWFSEMIGRARRGKPVAIETLRRQIQQKGGARRVHVPVANGRRHETK